MKRFLKHLLGRETRDVFEGLTILSLEPSYLCNLKCRMCQRSIRTHKRGVMSMETFRRLEPWFDRFTHVVLTGSGEPTLNTDLCEMIRMIHAKGVKPCMTTNGTTMTEELAKDILTSGIDHLTVSIDAGTKETYEFVRVGSDWDKVMANAARFTALRKSLPGDLCPTGVLWAFVLMRDNFRELPAAVRQAAQCGFTAIQTNYITIDMVDYEKTQMLHNTDGTLMDDIKADYEAAIAEAHAEAKRCGIILDHIPYVMSESVTGCQLEPVKSVYVDWRGYVTPCCLRLAGDGDADKHSDFFFGDVNVTDLDKILAGRCYQTYRSAWLAHELPATCRNCYMVHRINPSFFAGKGH